jgi:hypothetical protein
MRSASGPVLEGYDVDPDMVFVSPPLVPSIWYDRPRDFRDNMIKLRLKNLEGLKAGIRKPHEIVRDAKPVLEPEAWR